MNNQRSRLLQKLAATALLCTALGSAAADPPADKEKTTLGVSVNASILLGLGISVGSSLGDSFDTRTVFNGYSYSRQFDDSHNGTYDGKLRLQTFGVLADWHPFTGVFRLTLGALYDGNRLTVHGKAKNGQYDVGDCTYTSDPTNPLHLDGAADFRKLAPYFGLGWGGNMSAAPGFYGTFDLGAMYAGSARTTLTAGGNASNNDVTKIAQCGPTTPTDVSTSPEFQAELAKARADVEDKASKARFWPSIQFGLGWRF